MLQDTQLAQIQELLQQAQSCLILLGNEPNPDQVASALGLASALESLGKDVAMASPVAISDNFSHLPNTKQIEEKLGNRDLVVSFPYHETAVDKVSYHISDDNQTFFLVIKPQKNAPPLPANQVQFDYSGVDADVIFLIGVHDWAQLEHLYEGHEQFFSQAAVVSLHTFETSLGMIKIDISGSGSMSQAMVGLITGLGARVDAEAATALLAGIEAATDHLASFSATADTFEVVASLMRSGARRLRLASPPTREMPTILTSNGLASSGIKAKSDTTAFSAALSNKTQSKLPLATDTQSQTQLAKKIKQSPSQTAFEKLTEKNKTKKSQTTDDEPGSLSYQPGGGLSKN